MGAFRVSMVTVEQINRYFTQKKEDAIESAFLGGMEDVLREVAHTSFMKAGGQATKNTAIRKATRAVTEAESKFLDALEKNKELKALFDEYEFALTTETLFDQEEHFMNGFIEGYRFLKEIDRSGGTQVLDGAVGGDFNE